MQRIHDNFDIFETCVHGMFHDEFKAFLKFFTYQDPKF